MLLPSIGEGVIPVLDAVSNDKDLSSKMKFILQIDYKELNGLANVDHAKQWVRKYIEGHESILRHLQFGGVMGNGVGFGIVEISS